MIGQTEVVINQYQKPVSECRCKYVVSSLPRSKHMWISRGHVRVPDSAITHRWSSRSAVPTYGEGFLIGTHTHTRWSDLKQNHISITLVFSQMTKLSGAWSFWKAGSSRAKESCDFHHGEISFRNTGSLSASQHTHAHLDAHVNHLQIHTVHTQAPLRRWCKQLRARLSGPWAFLSAQTTPQEVERGAALSPAAHAVLPLHPPHVKSSLFQPAPHLPARRNLKPSGWL